MFNGKCFLAIILAIQCVPAWAQEASRDEPMVLTVYTLDGLPVYRVSDSGEPVFDASLLVSHLKQMVDPGSWEKPATITAVPESESLIVSQTRANHRAIASILYRMHVFAGGRDENVLKDAFASANATNRRVLLCVTEPTSVGCERFLDAFESERLQTLASHFVLVAVRNDRLVEVPEQQRNAFALRRDELLVFDSKSDVASRLSLSGDPTENAIETWLRQSAVSLESADTVLARGLAEATSQKKKALLVYSGPACVHCERMKAFLNAFKAQFSKDYVPVFVDTRMQNASERTAGFGRTEDEIPWLVVLSSDGQPLANSESEFGNIGFPVDRDGWLHFHQMIDRTRVRMTDREIGEIFGQQIE
ncbi:MAG: hypothetical protein AAFX06_05720 [Planctomycetota bacterium]